VDTLQVIAEPNRRKILRLVWDQERAATDIASNFDITFGAVSQHLAILRESGFVTVKRDGNRRMYRTHKEALGPFASILEEMWRDTLQKLASAIESAEGQ
jgi:DNA-binding transcriptional ArsR family regulator